MPFDRRLFLGAGLITGLSTAAATAAGPRAGSGGATPQQSAEPNIEPQSDRDQTAVIQQAIDRLSPAGKPVWLPPGRIKVRSLTLRSGTKLRGAPGATRLEAMGAGPLLKADGGADILIDSIVLDGLHRSGDGGLVVMTECARMRLSQVQVRRSAGHGLSLTRCSGSVADCLIEDVGEAGIFSLDARGLEIAHNTIETAANNGIQVWRSAAGDDGTIVTANRIDKILARSGGSGQNGNGINVYRAGGVLVTNNRIANCAFSAIRGNAASNIQMIANTCSRLGEVALYAEFGFQGAMIANNVVDHAAAGISVTNFNEGGRLAIVQGNLIRNLTRREREPVDKRGEGISVEADSIVTGNVIENAATAGLTIGWGAYMREVIAAQNLIRSSRIGIAVSGDKDGGAVMITNNMISGARDGAIRTMRESVPFGPDLARATTGSAQHGRITVAGNVVA